MTEPTAQYLTEPVILTPVPSIHASVRAMDDLAKATGRDIAELTGADPENAEQADHMQQLQVRVFLELHRRAAYYTGNGTLGPFPSPQTLWEAAAWADVEFREAAVNPLGDGSSPISPRSAVTGG